VLVAIQVAGLLAALLCVVGIAAIIVIELGGLTDGLDY
jgi:hypothetical protein